MAKGITLFAPSAHDGLIVKTWYPEVIYTATGPESIKSFANQVKEKYPHANAVLGWSVTTTTTNDGQIVYTHFGTIATVATLDGRVIGQDDT